MFLLPFFFALSVTVFFALFHNILLYSMHEELVFPSVIPVSLDCLGVLTVAPTFATSTRRLRKKFEDEDKEDEA